jgi:hypothetical protein
MAERCPQASIEGSVAGSCAPSYACPASCRGWNLAAGLRGVRHDQGVAPAGGAAVVGGWRVGHMFA